MNKQIRTKGGFTLIELLVVVLIIGILASIAIPQYFKVVEKSRMAEAMSLISTIKSAQERYVAVGGAYTNDFSQLDISYPNLTTSDITVKFFKATIANGTTTNGPSYQLTLARHTGSAGVASRYGAYSLTLNVPDAPIPTIGTCSNAGICDELLR